MSTVSTGPSGITDRAFDRFTRMLNGEDVVCSSPSADQAEIAFREVAEIFYAAASFNLNSGRRLIHLPPVRGYTAKHGSISFVEGSKGK